MPTAIDSPATAAVAEAKPSCRRKPRFVARASEGSFGGKISIQFGQALPPPAESMDIK